MVRKTLPISIPSFDSGRRTSSFLNVVANLRNVFTKRSNSVSFFTLQNKIQFHKSNYFPNDKFNSE